MASNSPILLVIDIQHGLVEAPSEWGPRSNPQLTENVAHLLKIWRAKSWPVLHVYHDELLEPDNPIQAKFPETFKPHASAAPLESEPVFIKHVGSPFVDTDLAKEIERLEKDGKRKIVVIGMDVSQCVNNTVRHGTDIGYEMLVVADACAGYGVEDWKDGKQLDAEETYHYALAMISGYGRVVNTKDILKALGYE
jgi:nicotinamidase-related amidase